MRLTLAESLAILALGFCLLVGWQSLHLDFPITDGAFYFEQAQLWTGIGIPLNREWSPAYVMGYGLLHAVFPSHHPLLLFLIHRGLILLLVVLFFWAATHRIFSEPTGLLLGLGLLGQEGVLGDLHVVHAAALAVTCLLCYLSLSPSRGAVWSLIGVSALGIWIRPEMIVVFLALIGTLLVRALKGTLRKPQGVHLIVLLLGLGAGSAVHMATGRAPGPGRAFDAFSQQFVWGEIRDSGGSLRGGHLDHQQRTKAVFGSVDTISGTFQANPGAFLGHVGRNLRNLPEQVVWIFFPSRHRSIWVATLFLFLLFMSLERKDVQVTSLFWIVSGAGATAGLAVCLLLNSSTVYLVQAAPFALVGGAMLLARIKGALSDRLPAGEVVLAHRRGLFLFGISILVVTLAPQPQFSGRQVVSLSEALMKNRNNKIVVYGFSANSYCAYLRSCGRDCDALPTSILEGPADLGELVHTRGLNAIIIDDFLRRFLKDADSSFIETFEAFPERWKFELIGKADGLLGSARLYVRQEPL